MYFASAKSVFIMQVMEDLRERFFGPSFELSSHDKVSDGQWHFVQLAWHFVMILDK